MIVHLPDHGQPLFISALRSSEKENHTFRFMASIKFYSLHYPPLLALPLREIDTSLAMLSYQTAFHSYLGGRTSSAHAVREEISSKLVHHFVSFSHFSKKVILICFKKYTNLKSEESIKILTKFPLIWYMANLCRSNFARSF